MRMRVLLINTNQFKSPQAIIPLGVCYVASAVKNAGHLVDSVFGFPHEHAIACCAAIAEHRVTVPLTTMDLNPAACSAELISTMIAAGFSAVGISAESGSDAMLARLGKGYSSATLRDAATALRRLRAAKLWMFLLGAPGETEATVRETVRFIETLPHDNLVCITQGIRLLPGTALQAELLRTGILAPDDPLIWPTFYFSEHVRPTYVTELLHASTFPSANVVTLHETAHRLIPFVQQVCSRCGVQPPYWRHLPGLHPLRRMFKEVLR
jgi:radical SAM superfamily enzyme YgiQ (UPF0313 family)